VQGLFGRLRRIFGRENRPAKATDKNDRSELGRRLVGVIERTQPEECTCEETYALIDQFTEALERGEDVDDIMPLVKRHLEICTDCMEEFEALLRVMQAPSAEAGPP
jgi:hypothetical protein